MNFTLNAVDARDWFVNKMRSTRVLASARSFVWKSIGLASTTASGIKLEITSRGDWRVFNEVFVNGEYDKVITQSLNSLPLNDSMTVFDLGANVGFFSLRVVDLLKRMGRNDVNVKIFAVEGCPRVVQQLKARVGSQSPFNGSIVPLFGLVGKRSGTGIIYENRFGPKSSIILESDRAVSVPFLDLTSIVSPVTPIDLLKCDIEGAEETFIESYPDVLAQTCYAIFELHTRLCDTQRCIDLLREAGLDLQEKINNSKDTTVACFFRDKKSIPNYID